MKNKTKLMIGALSLAMASGAVVTVTHYLNNKETHQANACVDKYNGFDIIEGSIRGYSFKYSDGFFVNNPLTYDYHMATMSGVLTHASDTVKDGQDYSQGAKNLVSVYQQIGYKDIYVSDSYKVKPTTDSIAAAIASKYVTINNRPELVVAVTVRSASYELEWASNVTLGDEGEAKGFKEAANEVNRYVTSYLMDIGASQFYLRGQVNFWVSGYSRGGATANLLAKRLIDRYQQWGNDIYCYAIEAPQGGVAEREYEERDYNCIHNVVNVNDIVPYVAPTAMGFKRYGVDHYIFGGEATQYIEKSAQFPNNLCDNKPISKMSDEQKKNFEYQLSQIIKNPDDREGYRPYTITRKNFKAITCSVRDSKKKEDTALFINRFINGLVTNGEGVDRKAYARGLENRARDLMVYMLNRGVDHVKDQFGWGDLTSVLPTIIGVFILDCKIHSDDSTTGIGTAWDTLFGETTVLLDCDNDTKLEIANKVIEKIKEKPELLDELRDYYPDGVVHALSDIHGLVYYLLRVHINVDDILTMGLNADNLLKNHKQIQAICLLRTQDNWY